MIDSMLKQQQEQFNQLFQAMDTVAPRIANKVSARLNLRTDKFIAEHAKEFSPSQLLVLARSFEWSEEQLETAVANYESALFEEVKEND